jgi:Tfp pilus assembly protein PilF
MKALARHTVLPAVLCLLGSTGCAQLPARPNGSAQDNGVASQLALGRLYERQGDTEKARQLYASLVQRYPAQKDGYHRLANLMARQGHHEQAQTYYQQALAISPHDANLLNDVGYWLYLQDRLTEAEGKLREAVARDPHYAVARNNLGLVVGRQGQFQESFAMFRHGNSEAQAHANLAFVHVQRGEFDVAQRHYSQALSLNNDMRPATEALVQLVQLERGERHDEPGAVVHAAYSTLESPPAAVSPTQASPAANTSIALGPTMVMQLGEATKPAAARPFAQAHGSAAEPEATSPTKPQPAAAQPSPAGPQQPVPTWVLPGRAPRGGKTAAALVLPAGSPEHKPEPAAPSGTPDQANVSPPNAAAAN